MKTLQRAEVGCLVRKPEPVVEEKNNSHPLFGRSVLLLIRTSAEETIRVSPGSPIPRKTTMEIIACELTRSGSYDNRAMRHIATRLST